MGMTNRFSRPESAGETNAQSCQSTMGLASTKPPNIDNRMNREKASVGRKKTR